MNDRVLRVLEYEKITAMLRANTSFSLSKTMAEELRPSVVYEEVEERLRSTEEARVVYQRRGAVPLGGIHDLRGSVRRAALGSSLDGKELMDIADTVMAGRRLKRFLLQFHEGESIPLLAAECELVADCRELEEEIRTCIDDNGEVLDQASPDLRKVRLEIRTNQSRLRERLESTIRSPESQKMLQENIITVRNDRYCLAVKAEYRSAFGGIVHDQSASGATLFIEPAAVVAMNNQIRELLVREQREIEKVLARISIMVGMEADQLTVSVLALGAIDFAFAKAKLAHAMKATVPTLNRDGFLSFKKARHPLLPIGSAVPISVELGKECILLVITGPNTGGKTVTLKTIGLLTLMAQSGLHIPADDGSALAVFEDVFADIGDEQSIEQSLSTFSSHMTNIIDILDRTNERTLVLFDELGAGTDPAEGAALAKAILEFVRARKARSVATTHYSELKGYAYTQPGVMNASVEFDVESLRPTYRLLVGVPGRSNAFAIAQRLGLPRAIIDAAKANVASENVRVDDLLRQLDNARIQAERDALEASIARQEAQELRDAMRREQDKWESERDTLVQKAREEARQLVRKAQREATDVLQELRRIAQEERGQLKEHRLVDLSKQLDSLLPETPAGKKRMNQPSKSIQVGDTVLVLRLNQKGQVTEQTGNESFIVQIGSMKLKTKLDEIEFASREKDPLKPVTIVQRSGGMVKLELDVRGTTVEEAELAIEKYIDDAVLSGLPRVTIIHGKGTGALRSGIQQYLREHPSVEGYKFGGQNEGGNGVTIVELR